MKFLISDLLMIRAWECVYLFENFIIALASATTIITTTTTTATASNFCRLMIAQSVYLRFIIAWR